MQFLANENFYLDYQKLGGYPSKVEGLIFVITVIPKVYMNAVVDLYR